MLSARIKRHARRRKRLTLQRIAARKVLHTYGSGVTTADPNYYKQGIYRTGGWASTHEHYCTVKIGLSRADVLAA